MATISTVLEDTPQFTLYEEVDDQTDLTTYRRVWKAGTPAANRTQLKGKLTVARDVFRTNYTNWPTMTNAQKDAANRQAQRALANLLGWVLEQSDPGD